MSEALLYDVGDSPFCIKARIVLQVKAVPYRRVTVTVDRARELRRLNPKGQVPVLVDGDHVVADSSAIARYLEQHYPTPALLPADPAARAYAALLEEWADEVLYWLAGAAKWGTPANQRVVRRTVDEIRGRWPAALVWQALRWQVRSRLRALRLFPGTPEPTLRLKENLAILTGLLDGRDFLIGRSPTLADIAVFSQVAWLKPYAEWTLVEDVPVVEAWAQRLLEMPAVAAALPA